MCGGGPVLQVCSWLAVTVGLPQYQHRFREAAVSGPVLLSLTDSDLADSLGVRHPLHRRKIILAVDELAEADPGVVEADAASGGRWSMRGEADKLALVIDLKKAFDKLDRNGDGELGVDELAAAFGHMGIAADVAMEKVCCARRCFFLRAAM